MGETVDWLQDGDVDAHVVVRAAMAHLHVVSVHPFRDGNGRISRIVLTTGSPTRASIDASPTSGSLCRQSARLRGLPSGARSRRRGGAG
jgi:fido (protein-threonine AMPylation protein)